MRDLIVVGSLNVDISLVAEKIPQPGETIRAGELAIGPGGKGLNQAIAAARMGARVHMVGRVGSDRFADIPLAALTDAGVSTTYVATDETLHTGTASIVVAQDSGQNAIAVASGANGALTPEHVREAVSAFRASAVLLVQLEAPPETVAEALALAHEHALVTVLDPAPARPLDDAVLANVDVLTPNESEARFLTGIEVNDIESAAVAGRMLADRTQGDIVITLGESGCLWVYATGFEHIPAPPADPVDTTGAGDAFNGALGVALAAGQPMAQALRLAVSAGTAATLRRGAATAMPTREQLGDGPR
jgi:ribokinase